MMLDVLILYGCVCCSIVQKFKNGTKSVFLKYDTKQFLREEEEEEERTSRRADEAKVSPKLRVLEVVQGCNKLTN